MTIKNRPSPRKCINNHCKTCIYDPKAAGTWRQQVTLCPVSSCSLYPVRPVTKSDIPECVLAYYDRHSLRSADYGGSRPQEGPILRPTIETGTGGMSKHRIAAKQAQNKAVSGSIGEING